jgi:DNA (cytosine-5)-methyltransferase 1
LRAAGFPAVEADVRDLDYKALAGTIDVLWASPPCQAWSGLGKRQGSADNARNGWPWTLDVIDAVRPRWVVLENVAAMKGNPYLERSVFPRLRQRFRHVDARVLDAADFGVAQSRHRLFIIAGPTQPGWPTATHGPGTGRAHVGVNEVLRFDDDVVAMAHECNAGWGLARVPIALDRPAPTITAGSARSHGGNGLLFVRRGATLGHPLPVGSTLHRRATPQECARIQSFPDLYPFVGSTTERRMQVGNAVPPSLAAAVARAVRAAETGVETVLGALPTLASITERIERVLAAAVALVRRRPPRGVSPDDIDGFVAREAPRLRDLVAAFLSRRSP